MSGWGGWLRRGLVWWLLWEVGLRLWLKLRPEQRLVGHGWSPARRLQWLIWPPEALVARLEITPGMTVVEVGAGAGPLTPWLARAVGPAGQVLALDEWPAAVERLRLAALEQDLLQITAQQAAPTALPPEAAGSDLIVLTTTFGAAPDKQAVAQEAYRALRPGGAVAVTELLLDPHYSLASTVVTHLVLAGFGIERELGDFAGYTVIGRKPA